VTFIASQPQTSFAAVNAHVADEEAINHYRELCSVAQVELVYTNLELGPAAVDLILSKACRHNSVKRRACKPRKQFARVR
jgi:hypothetical protein